MKVDLWLPLYPADYLRDTWDLTAEEHGAYLLLLMHLWTSGGRLPLDRLPRLTRVPQDRWPEVWSVLSRFFQVDGQEVTQGRLARELQFARDRASSASERGKLGGRPRKLSFSEQKAKVSETESSAEAEGKLKESCEEAQGKATESSSPSPSPPPPPSQIPSPPPRKKQKVGLPPDPARDAAVLDVLAHYRTYHPRAVPRPHGGMVEWQKVAQRLADGYSADDLKRAIDGYHADPWHCGENDRATKFLSLELIARDSAHVERGIAFPLAHERPVSLDQRTTASLRAAKEWLDYRRSKQEGAR